MQPKLERTLRSWPSALAASMVLLLAVVPSRAQDRGQAELLLGEGIEYYFAEDYQSALATFHRAEGIGLESGALYYNIGNCYFRLNQIGRAILYYERARRLEPSEPLLLHSLRVARRKTLNKFSVLPRPFYVRYWARAVAYIGPLRLFLVGAFVYLIGLAALGYRVWSGSRNPWVRRSYVVGLLVGIPLILAAGAASMHSSARETAVVTEGSIGVYDVPDLGDSRMTIYEGLVVRVLQEQEDWVEVQLPDGDTGWITRRSLENV